MTKIFYIAPDDPWDRWTNSGVSLRISEGLRDRGLLHGAISRHATDAGQLLGPTLVGRFRRKLSRPHRRKAPPRNQIDEREGVIGACLAELPPGTCVLYHYVLPVMEPALPIRRFLFQDLTVRLAVAQGAYGHDKLSAADVEEKIEQQRDSLHRSDGVITFATFLADAFASDYGFPRAKVHVIKAGPMASPRGPVDLSLMRYRTGELLFVGRAWDRKGGPLLLEAFALARARVPSMKLTVVSAGAPPINAPGVTHIPFASDRVLHELFSRAAAFCMPSVCETWGLVYGEAQHFGMPVLGFREWALPDIVNHGVTGLLAATRSPEALADILVQAFSDPVTLAGMGRAAHAHATTELTWERTVDRLVSATVGAPSAPDASPA